MTENFEDRVTVSHDGDTFVDIDAINEELSVEGRLVIDDSSGRAFIEFDKSVLTLGSHVAGGGEDGDLFVENNEGEDTIHLGGNDAQITLGRTEYYGHRHGGEDGDIYIYDDEGNQSIHLGGNDARLQLGEDGHDDGDIFIHDHDGWESIHLGGNDARLSLGHDGDDDGDIFIHDDRGNESIHLGGNDARLRLGRNGDNDGDIYVHDNDGNETIHMRGDWANLRLGGHDQDGDIFLDDGDGNRRIHLDAETGDIKLSGGDCAENFDVQEASGTEPGSVLVAEGDKLRTSSEPYDTRVAGVVSGAGSMNPGIRLDDHQDDGDRLPVALVGKVECKVDAEYGSIEVGDMLTTSSTDGHAMKADDRERAFGATLGKALEDHETGRGQVPVLVALQ